MEIRKSKVYSEPDDIRGMDSFHYRVTKTGYVLSQQEDHRWTPIWRKSNDKDTDPLQGFQYYQIAGNTTACAQCQEHIGAIYPIASAVEGKTKPPFHPNCLCKISGFSLTNPNKDPWKAELILWVGLMYGGGSLTQQAKKVIDHYGWTEYTTEYMAGVLSSISNIANVTKRIAAFYSRLDNPDGLTISQDDLDRFGWSTPTQEEADRLMAAFELFGITSRESMIQFIAIAAAESGYGLEFLEMGDDAYWESHGYNRNTRGAGYIQVTHDYNHRAFLDFIGDDYSGADTASYIAENYPLEVSVWFWSQLNLYGYEGGVNEFIETKTAEGGDPLLIFLKTAYYVGGMPGGSFNSDINDAIAGKADYTITEDYLIINGNQYSLPSRWKIRLEAYEKAQSIW